MFRATKGLTPSTVYDGSSGGHVWCDLAIASYLPNYLSVRLPILSKYFLPVYSSLSLMCLIALNILHFYSPTHFPSPLMFLLTYRSLSWPTLLFAYLYSFPSSFSSFSPLTISFFFLSTYLSTCPSYFPSTYQPFHPPIYLPYIHASSVPTHLPTSLPTFFSLLPANLLTQSPMLQYPRNWTRHGVGRGRALHGRVLLWPLFGTATMGVTCAASFAYALQFRLRKLHPLFRCGALISSCARRSVATERQMCVGKVKVCVYVWIYVCLECMSIDWERIGTV